MRRNDTSSVQLIQANESTEEWRPIRGYEGAYEVSNHGRVRSLDRDDSAGRPRKGKILSPSDGRYLGVSLRKDDSGNFVHVHRIVADAFLGKCPDGYQVHHRDADTHNNRVENMEYVTPRRNVEFACEAGIMGKLSHDDVRNIYSSYVDGVSTIDQMAQDYEVCRTTICDALAGRTHSTIFVGKNALTPLKLPGKRKISDDVVREIRSKYKTDGQSCYTLAKEYSLHPTTINKIVLGIRRPTVT